MAGRSQRSVAVLLAFLALLTGVMGESLDTDLVGIVVAAVCIAILFIVLCSFLAFCCFRGVDLDRNWVVGRKDSGSVSNPSSRPPYTIATDPIMYALPSPLHGDVFLEQRHTKLRHSDRLKETPRAVMATPQPNGHAGHHLPSSGINYRAIHTQDVAVGTTPLWLKKSYVETEKSLEIHEDDDDEAEDGKPVSAPPSAKQPASSPQPQPLPQSKPQPQPQERGAGRAVRAEVSPKHSRLDSRDVLHVSEEFTIIDFVDPLQFQQHQQQQQQQRQQQQQQKQQQINGRPTYSYRSYLDRDFLHTTAITRYCVPKRHLADTSHGSSGSGYVPPVSTSTPRSPSDEGPAQPDTDHPRMRKPKEGSVRIMPVKSVGYKGDFQL